ncbi:MAG: hypothetical protein HDS14_00525 [Bacteroides sp.]|nr:hypothetical protein [Bacteroides sp.]
MKEEELIKLLQKITRHAGICRDGFSRMLTMNLDSLVEYYATQPDWCLERNIPTLDILSKYFSDRQSQGVYIDCHFNGETLIDRQFYILHHCTGKINTGLNVNKGIIPMIYLANDCDITIESIDTGFRHTPWIIPVYSFGNNKIHNSGDAILLDIKYEAVIDSPHNTEESHDDLQTTD